MTPTLTHIALHIHDLSSCIAFYQDFCGMEVCHERRDGHVKVAWVSEPGKQDDFIIVLIEGGQRPPQSEGDFSHLGFAVDSQARVDEIASRADAKGCLAWAPREEPYPVGYYCGVRDPDGNIVEFSFGQPLGPGSR